MGVASEVAGALITGGAGLISSVAGNKSNKNIAQMNNSFNERMLQKQMDYNTQMYDKQLGDQWSFYNDAKENQWKMFDAANSYNSAENQRSRLEAAGLNPYMMMNGSSAGIASSVAGSTGQTPSHNGISTPTATPYSADYSAAANGLGQAAELFLRKPDNDVKRAQALNLRIEAQYLGAKRLAEIQEMVSRTKNDKVRVGLEKMLAGIQKDLASSTMDLNKSKIGLNQVESGLKASQRLQIEKATSFMDENQRLYVSSQLVQIKNLVKQGELTSTEVNAKLYSIAKTIAETKSLDIKNASDAEWSSVKAGADAVGSIFKALLSVFKGF